MKEGTQADVVTAAAQTLIGVSVCVYVSPESEEDGGRGGSE